MKTIILQYRDMETKDSFVHLLESHTHSTGADVFKRDTSCLAYKCLKISRMRKVPTYVCKPLLYRSWFTIVASWTEASIGTKGNSLWMSNVSTVARVCPTPRSELHKVHTGMSYAVRLWQNSEYTSDSLV